MPHLRDRTLENELKKDLTWSPIVSVLGMRQVGKSTLLRSLGHSYLTLDDDAVLQKLERGDWSEIESATTPVVIDEAQKSAGLFDRVKLLVDQRKRPGQFLLTGSVRFLSKKQIRESLTGRTSLLELLPLTMAEADSKPPSDFLATLSLSDPEEALEKLESQCRFSAAQTSHYLLHGGMPGICFKRDGTIRERMRDSLIETLLMRDLQTLVRTRAPYQKLRSLLTLVAQNQGEEMSLAALGRRIHLSTPTVIQLLQAFESLFLIRPLGRTYFFTDCGMASYLNPGHERNPDFDLERLAYQELYAQLVYSYRAQFTLERYLTRGGVKVPFVIKLQRKPNLNLAIGVDAEAGATEKSLKSLTWYSKRSRERIVSVVLHQGPKGYIASNGTLCIPIQWMF
jgi:predicted AAA+ superfamily ATPase